MIANVRCFPRPGKPSPREGDRKGGWGRVADATALAPRRSDDAIAFATARSSNNGDGVVPPQPFNL